MDYKSIKIYLTSALLLLLTFIDLLNGQHMSSTLNYRRQLNYMRIMAQKAYEHGIRINEEAQCSKPKPELLYINDNKKIYLPRATLLHRCSDLHGCCPHATHSCEPISTEKVTMYFFVIGVQPSNLLRRNQNIEQLTFVNHTECACKPIDPVWNGNNRPVGNSENVPFTDVNANNNTESLNNTQVRNIRDPNTPPINTNDIIYLNYQPISSNTIEHSSETFQGRTNNPSQIPNHQNINRQQTINSYKDNENALKFWAKMMGYNADKRKILINNHSKRYNKRNVTKKSVGSHSRVSFNSPDVSYSYEIHNDDNGFYNDEPIYYPQNQQPTMYRINNDANSIWRQSRKNIPAKYYQNNRYNFKNRQSTISFPHQSSSRLTLIKEPMIKNDQLNDISTNKNYHSSLTKMNIVNNQNLPLSMPYSQTETAVVPQLAVEPVVPQAYGHYSLYNPINNDINNHIDATPFYQPLWIQ